MIGLNAGIPEYVGSSPTTLTNGAKHVVRLSNGPGETVGSTPIAPQLFIIKPITWAKTKRSTYHCM